MNNVTWLVDYDNLFNGRQQLFDFCRVRFQLLNGYTGYTIASNQGYLSASFPTDFNAQTTNGCVLGLLIPFGPGPGIGVYLQNSQNDVGVDICHKQLNGVQPLTIQWINMSGELMPNVATQTVMELIFELYN
jgi:hypothetical protein